MDAILAVAIFIIGFAFGSACLWVFCKQRAAQASERERNLAIADVRVANERASSKDSTIEKLENQIRAKDETITSVTAEKARLERAQAIIEANSKKDIEKLDEKLQLLQNAEKQFKDAFKVLAADALKDNNQEFVKLSKPVQDTLTDINAKILVVNQSAANLGLETGKLVKALQKPEIRGQWGEMHLLRVVEVCGLTDRCDFHEQHVIGENRELRPDLVVHLPGEKNVAVDAKAPIRAFLEVADASDEDGKQEKLKEFISHIREHVRLLGSKAYHQSLGDTPEFVVLYLPTEAIFTSALSLDSELLEFAAKYRVHLAGPTVLITLLRSIAHGWKQVSLAKHAKEICDLAEELYKRIAVFGGHMGKIGASLNKTVSAYNQAVGSLESRVMPQARKFEQLGAAPADAQLDELSQIEATSRALQCAELMATNSSGDLEEDQALFLPR